jgi:hypothetical protein
MCEQRFFDGISAPARPVGHDELAVLHLGGARRR